MPAVGGGSGSGGVPATPPVFGLSLDLRTLGIYSVESVYGTLEGYPAGGTRYDRDVDIIFPPVYVDESGTRKGMFKRITFRTTFSGSSPSFIRVRLYAKGAMIADSISVDSPTVSMEIDPIEGDNLITLPNPILSEYVIVRFTFTPPTAGSRRNLSNFFYDSNFQDVIIHSLSLDVEDYGDEFEVRIGDAF